MSIRSVPVQDCIVEGLTKCQFHSGLITRSAARLFDKLHQPIHQRRDGLNFAWYPDFHCHRRRGNTHLAKSRRRDGSVSHSTRCIHDTTFTQPGCQTTTTQVVEEETRMSDQPEERATACGHCRDLGW